MIIAAIAIPNLLRARIAANESSSASGIRTINTAEVAYITAFPSIGYSPALANLGPGAACPNPPTNANACLIDNNLASNGLNPPGSGKSAPVFAFGLVAFGFLGMGPVTICLIDNNLASNGLNPPGSGKSGYNYAELGVVGAGAVTNTNYVATANPISVNTTGVKSFCAIEDAVVRAQTAAAIAGYAACQAVLPLNQ